MVSLSQRPTFTSKFLLPIITLSLLLTTVLSVDVNDSFAWLESEHVRDVVSVFAIGLMFSVLAVLQRFANVHVSKRAFLYVLQCLLCAAILWVILFLVPITFFLEAILSESGVLG